ncbi:MAG: sulfite exporter TauE/SafE family protein [Lachnospiraceae bacterium]|nr:sulfite exporter TauE/SafE family protein [Lachnospiraceae bacterium]
MIPLVLFIVCILASSVGAVVGAGGGVIIKPVLDMIGILPVSTVSFCSGCTVLGMSVCSLIRGRKDGVRLQVRISTALAVGAVLGGLLGKWLFELVRNSFPNERALGAIQAVFLTIITFLVLLYVCNKDRLPSKRIQNLGVSVIIGVVLGVISSFLGIGGGTSNVAVLFFFFSMEAKEAAKNSIYIIIFSQISSIASALVTSSVPDFEWMNLICMVAGGISGALVGAAISRRIDNAGVEKILKILLLLIVAMDFYNVLQYTIL